MTHFEDLSPYRYSPYRDEGRETLCVGWLDPSHQFPTGETPDTFRAALLSVCVNEPVLRARGFHPCYLPPCHQRPVWPPPSIEVDGEEFILGSAEIRIVSDAGIVYAAPDLIYHYVVEHGYLPPAQFVEAVVAKGVMGIREG